MVVVVKVMSSTPWPYSIRQFAGRRLVREVKVQHPTEPTEDLLAVMRFHWVGHS